MPVAHIAEYYEDRAATADILGYIDLARHLQRKANVAWAESLGELVYMCQPFAPSATIS